jgi:hypothetical protein
MTTKASKADLAASQSAADAIPHRCFNQPCDEPVTRMVILETLAMTIKMPMCADHASEAQS